MADFRIKQGEALLLQIKAENDDGQDADLANVTLAAQVRTATNALVAVLPIEKTQEPPIATIAVADTTAWPLGTHRIDFQAVVAGLAAYSDTVTLQIAPPVTA